MKVTLNGVGSLIDATTAQNTINANNQTIENAFDNTLSLDGTQPNAMNGLIDMNSNQIVNLPAPATANSPLRLQDLASFTSSGTIQTIPAGGTTGQSLQKTSNTDYATNWGNNVTSVGLSLPADFTVTNSPVTSTGTLTAAYAVTPTGTGALVKQTSPTLITPVLGVATATSVNKLTLTAPATSATLTLTDGTVITGPAATGTLVTKTSTDTLTNKTLTSPVLTTPALGVATATSINGSTVSPGHYSGEPSTGSATAGEIGEYIESVIVSGSAVSLVTGTSKTITSISLTAGDWDVDVVCYFLPANTTSVTSFNSGLSLTTNVLDTTPGRFFSNNFSTGITFSGAITFTTMLPPYRLSLSTTTSIFMVAQSFFTVSTNVGFGIIRARRVR